MESASLPPIIPKPSEPTRFTVEQYLDLLKSGELTEDDRVELLEGVIVAMAPIGDRHTVAMAYLNRLFVRGLGDRAWLFPQCPFRASDLSMPEPDIALSPGPADAPPRGYPRAAYLLIEVSDTTLRMDRLSKSRIYAAAGVPEYWIVNLRENVVEVYRQPDPATATWRERVVAGPGQTVAPLAFPDVQLDVADLMRVTMDTEQPPA